MHYVQPSFGILKAKIFASLTLLVFLLSSRKIHDITLTGLKNERLLQPNAPASRTRYINIHLILHWNIEYMYYES